MAKAVGLDAGSFEVKLVELDGSYKRPKLTRVAIEPVPDSTAPDLAPLSMAQAALTAFENSGVGKDGFTLAFPCRETVLRQLTVPFVGRDQIRKVIKFEAEGEIHSHNVDDMVVDFATLAELTNETRVLVAAAPKPIVRAHLDALERSGIEPESIDLDTMALFRVAEWCGAFNGGDASGTAPDGDDAPLVAVEDGPPTRLVIDIGARSTRVLVVQDGKLVDMRALRTGADSMADEIGGLMGVGLTHAREAVEESLRTDEDFIIVAGEDPLGEIEETEGEQEQEQEQDDAEEEAARTQLIPHSEVSVARDRYLLRLRRELIRFLTSVPSSDQVEVVWVTGGASKAPGVIGVIEDVFSTTVRELDILDNLNHKLDADEARTLGPKLATAVGLALGELGGAVGFNFRQEELAFTKGFDRIKFPLAIASMLALFLTLVFALKSWRELKQLGTIYGETYSVERTEGARGRSKLDAQFLGYVGSLVNKNSWFDNDRFFDQADYRKLQEKLLETDVFKRLPIIRQELQKYYRAQQNKSGYYSDLRLGSGLGALVETASILKRLEGQLGRFLVLRMDAKLPFDARVRRLTFEVILRTDEMSDFRSKWKILQTAFREACDDPDSSFAALRRESQELETFEAAGGAGAGAKYRIALDVKPDTQYPIFPRTNP